MSTLILGAAAPLTMSSREIAGLTGKEHKNVIRDIRAMLDELAGDGSDLSHMREDLDGRGYTAMFHLNRELTDTLLTGYSVPLRRRVVARWHAGRAPVPRSFAQALRLAAEQQEQIELQQAALEAARPKVTYADAMLNADGTVLVRDAAKTIGVPVRKLEQALRAKGVILPHNAPAARYVAQGYFKEALHHFETNTRGGS